MKNATDQLDFNFSRPIDIQRNINLEIINNCILNLNDKNRDNKVFTKHLRLLVIELYFCWIESNQQFLSVSMSKRGYNARSRYNPNNISSYLIKIINFLNQKNLIELHPGFFDARTKKSRLTRIRSSKLLINHFKRIEFLANENINHNKREFLLNYKKGNLFEYDDTYETQEKKIILRDYNKLILKTLFDIPSYEEGFLLRGDKRKIAISHLLSSTYSFNDNVINKGVFGGCWWNKIDLYLFFQIRNRLLINNQETSHFNLLDFFGDYLTIFSKTNIALQPKSFSSVLNYDQLCYLIIKSFRSKNNGTFMRSIFNEKKKISLDDYSNKEIRDAVINHIINNQRLSNFIFRGKDIEWTEFVSTIFYNLIGKLNGMNIPIFLVRDKVFFPTSKESIVLEKVEEILLNKLKIRSIKLNCKVSEPLELKKKGIFGRLVGPKTKFSKRYLENKKYFGII